MAFVAPCSISLGACRTTDGASRLKPDQAPTTTPAHAAAACSAAAVAALATVERSSTTTTTAVGNHHGSTEPQDAGTTTTTTTTTRSRSTLLSGSASTNEDSERWEMSKTVYVAHPAAKVWALMDDFVAIYRWHPAVVSSVLASGEPQQPGVVRYVVTASGDTFYERLDELDSAGHRVAYTALDNTFGLVDYHAQISLRPDTAQPDSDAATVMTWSSNMSPSPVKSRDQIYALLGESFVRCGQYISQVLSAGSGSGSESSDSEAVALPAAGAAAAGAPAAQLGEEDVVGSSSSSLEAAGAAGGPAAAPITAPASQAPTTVVST